MIRQKPRTARFNTFQGHFLLGCSRLVTLLRWHQDFISFFLRSDPCGYAKAYLDGKVIAIRSCREQLYLYFRKDRVKVYHACQSPVIKELLTGGFLAAGSKPACLVGYKM